MAIKVLKFTRQYSIFALLFMLSAFSNADNLMLQELHHTVEEAKISVVTGDTEKEGTVTATLLECPGCTPQTYKFDGATVLMNPFGGERPIKELKSWSGNRAMFHYLKANKRIEQIQILP